MATPSLQARYVLLAGITAMATAAAALLFGRIFDSWWQSLAAALIVTTPLLALGVRLWVSPLLARISAVADGVSSFRDNDFSLSIVNERDDELGKLVGLYNEVGQILRNERQNLHQRELLLDTVIQSTPLALLLTDPAGKVIYSNTSARRLFRAGRRLEGFAFDELIGKAAPELRSAVGRGGDSLFTISGDDEETWHFSSRGFMLNARSHQLYLFRQMTRELNRQEVATWKKVLRVISHELNNSLAPISSLAHSGRVLAEAEDMERVRTVLTTIEERAAHLKGFIQGYVRFAKLPQPLLAPVVWDELLSEVGNSVPFRQIGTTPQGSASLDRAQIGQVLINLLKNAHEAESESADITLELRNEGPIWHMRIADRGTGMSDTVLASALLPFYSTKRSGSGLGLSLCREIVEAHGGRISLGNRRGGGLAVDLWLPATSAAA